MQDLLAYRERLINTRSSLSVANKELKRVKTNDETTEFIFTSSHLQIKNINISIKEIEIKLLELLKIDEEISKNYDIITSIKSVGIINNIRNKMIHLIFALVKTGEKYDKNYVHPLSCEIGRAHV